MEQTVKKKFGIRDIMTIAAMMVINFAIAMVIGMVTLSQWLSAPLRCLFRWCTCTVLPVLMLLLEQSFIWSQQTASTNMAFCLRGPQSTG